MDASRLAEERVRFLREAAIAYPAMILALSLFGAITPPLIRIGSDETAVGSPADTLLISLAILPVPLAAWIVAVWGRRAIIEHRPPWPFRRRPPGPDPYLRETVATLAAVAIAASITDGWWSGTRLYRLDDGRFMWVALPAEFAMQYVALFAVSGLAFLIARLTVTRQTKAHGPQPESDTRSVTEAADAGDRPATTPPNGYWTAPEPGPWRSTSAFRFALVGCMTVLIGIGGYVMVQVLAPTYPVALTITPHMSGDTLVIDGQTDLPDGAVISYDVLDAWSYRQFRPNESDTPPSSQPGEPPTPQGGSTKVVAGRFQGTANLTDWPPETVHVFAYFDADPEQPPAVRARFGENNEHLGGPNVSEDSDGLRSAIAQATVTLP